MSEQETATTTAEQERPAPEGYTSWQEYWTAQGMPWRTEPAIDKERQRLLAERRTTEPSIHQGTYPFKDIEPRLTRADIEWLLDTLQDRGGSGPITHADEH